VVLVAGTRPECIKLVPIVRTLAAHPELRMVLVNSGQHSAAVQRTFAEFGIACDVSLAALPPFHHLAAAHEHLREELCAVFRRYSPALAIVQGDTLTAYSGARAARFVGVRLAHVEAGLRTSSVSEPFPEEWFRRQIARYADIHFAPTPTAAANLLREGSDPNTVYRVGNTGIDSLRSLLEQSRPPLRLGGPRNVVLVTLHRRENHDRNAGVVCAALLDLMAARRDLQVVFPVHPNPRVAATIRRHLDGHPAVSLVDPMNYRAFIELAARAALIISDSGGVQEEVPHLGTPLLVPRCNTERPEGIETGFVQLVRPERAVIVTTALAALSAPRRRPLPFDDNGPFGAGDAGQQIVRVLETVLAQRVPA
jgi:UDP-N-acetylglucosamine 2-epimerase (non-hydrolysing)